MRCLFLLFGLVMAPAVQALDVPVLTDGALASYEQRMRASYAEGSQHLSTSDAQSLVKFLSRLPSADAVSIDELAALKNNAADLLLTQAPPPAGLRTAFEAAFKNPAQGEIWREYIVQKIPELAVGLAGAERKRALAFLHQRLDDTESIFAGTALLGLQRLHTQTPPLVSTKEVATAATKLLTGPAYADATKLTALQVLALHDAAAARAQARQWLTGDHPVMLKVSALATLGQVGEPQDRSLLERYARSPELRLRTSARAALGKLTASSQSEG